VGRSQCGFGMPNREVQIKPVHQEGHPIGHRMFPQKKNPTGRNPWGPGEPRKAARGGKANSTRDEPWMSRRSAPRGPDPQSPALLYPVPSITPSWKCRCARLSKGNLVGDEGRPHGAMGLFVIGDRMASR
jgi:hypothetical protein